MGCVRDKRDHVEIRGVEITGEQAPDHAGGSGERENSAQRPWLSVWFRCCHVYARIYRVRDGSAYSGRCPKCGAEVRALIGGGGTSRRFFEAS